MRKVIYVKHGTWWVYNGSLRAAKKLVGTAKHQYFDGELGPQTITARERPSNYFNLSGEDQWAIDKRLGILDWDGLPGS